jgi:hypothetical protein
MKKCELELEPYAVPRMNVVSAVVERGFTISGEIGYDDVDKDDWQEDEDLDW